MLWKKLSGKLINVHQQAQPFFVANVSVMIRDLISGQSRNNKNTRQPVRRRQPALI